MDLINKVEETINKYRLFEKGNRILVGVSGGPDSLALLHILKRLQEKYQFYLHIAHLDHKFRGEASFADAEFVAKIANDWQIPITLEEYDVKSYQQSEGLSPEDAAREIRYSFFFELAERLNLDKIAVGHHAKDQAETVLMKFLRGAGLKGLGGINPKQEKLVRPLIELNRDEIEEYCSKYNLQPRLDATNLETIYLRNKIRLELIPLLEKEYNRNIISTLNRNANLLREEDDFLQHYTKDKLDEMILSRNNDKIIIDKGKLVNLHLAIQRRTVREILKSLKGDYKDFYYHHIEAVLDLAQKGETGSQIDLPREVIVRLSYDQLILTTAKMKKKVENFKSKLSLGKAKVPKIGLQVKSEVVDKNYPWREWIKEPQRSCFDFSKVGSQFYVRKRQAGDRFYPLGMKGSKKVKDFLIDEKIPVSKRGQIPIFTTLDGKIFWLAGLRVDNRFKVTDQTDKILIVEFSN